MTIYTYLGGKAELLDVMLDATYAGMQRADSAGLHWRERLEAVAHENRALFGAHPWAAAISTSPPLGPGLIDKHELAALDGLGLDDVEMDAALTFQLAFVRSCARAGADARAAQRESALDDARW